MKPSDIYVGFVNKIWLLPRWALGGVFLILMGAPVQAQTTYYWLNSASGNWSTVGNWSLTSATGSAAATVPTNTDTVIFSQTSGTVTSTMDLTLATGSTNGLRNVQFTGGAAYVVNLTAPLRLNSGAGNNREIYNTSSGGVTINLGSSTNNISLNSAITITNTSAAGTLTINGVGTTLSTNTIANQVRFSASNGAKIDVNTVISGTAPVILNAGSGIVTFRQSNTYSGSTNVNGGMTLNVLGANIGSNTMTMTTTSVLAGTGTATRTTTSGRITPGNALNAPGAATSIGNLTIGGAVGSLAMNSSSSYLWELGNSSGVTAGTDWDLITVLGTFSVGATGTKTVFIENLDSNWTAPLGRSYKILSGTGISQATVDLLTLAFGPSGSAAWGGYNISTFHLEARSDGIYLVELPEPSTYAACTVSVLAGAAAWKRCMSRRRMLKASKAF